MVRRHAARAAIFGKVADSIFRREVIIVPYTSDMPQKRIRNWLRRFQY